MNNYPDERNASVIFIENTKTVMTLARKHSKYNVPQNFVEMQQLQNKRWLVRY